MENGLYLPSDVTVRGVAGKAILLKNAGVENMLEDDGGFGEMECFVTTPPKFRPGMGITIFDEVLNSHWDIGASAETRAGNGTKRYSVYKVNGADEVTLNNNRFEGNLVREYAECAWDGQRAVAAASERVGIATLNIASEVSAHPLPQKL